MPSWRRSARECAALRSSDVKCRYGGDEFLVILPETPMVGARQVCETLRRSIEKEPTWSDGSVVVTASLVSPRFPRARTIRWRSSPGPTRRSTGRSRKAEPSHGDGTGRGSSVAGHQAPGSRARQLSAASASPLVAPAGAPGKGHRPVRDGAAVDAGQTFEHAHAAPEAFHARLDLHHVAGVDRAAEPLARCRRRESAAAVLGLRQDQDRPHLCDPPLGRRHAGRSARFDR